MNFAAAVVSSPRSGYALPARDDTTAARYATNRHGTHLSDAKRFSDQVGHL